jgi:hypothetical protein
VEEPEQLLVVERGPSELSSLLLRSLPEVPHRGSRSTLKATARFGLAFGCFLQADWLLSQDPKLHLFRDQIPNNKQKQKKRQSAMASCWSKNSCPLVL